MYLQKQLRPFAGKHAVNESCKKKDFQNCVCVCVCVCVLCTYVFTGTSNVFE